MLLDAYFRRADAVLLVYDIEDPISFADLVSIWAPAMHARLTFPDYLLFVVGIRGAGQCSDHVARAHAEWFARANNAIAHLELRSVAPRVGRLFFLVDFTLARLMFDVDAVAVAGDASDAGCTTLFC